MPACAPYAVILFLTMRGDDLLLAHLALLFAPLAPAQDERESARDRLRDELGDELAEALVGQLAEQ